MHYTRERVSNIRVEKKHIPFSWFFFTESSHLGAIESIAAIIVTRRWPKIDADPVQSGGINAGETMAGA